MKMAPDTCEDTDTAFDHFDLLVAMGQDFASTLDVEDTLRRGLALITRHLNAAGGALFLLDEANGVLTCKACFGETEIVGLTINREQGIVGRCVENNAGEIVSDVENDPAFHKSVDEKTGFVTRSILCVPMSVKDQRIGAIELVNKLDNDGLFAEADLQLLQALSSSAALAILNARMAESLVEQERMRRELELAAEIQRSLLPEQPSESFPVCGVNVPARMVSGDFYDFFALDDGRIYFNLADVSGKGMNAALMMAKTASLFRCLGKEIHDPGQLLARINKEICETAARGMFVTMVGGIYDPSTGVVRLANAGHEPPLYHHPSMGFAALPAAAPPLGISPLLTGNGGFPEQEINLDGGTLYVFTDGVTEGYLEDASEMTVEGLKSIICESASLPISGRINAVIECIDRGNVELRDDITMLAIDDNAEIEKRTASHKAATKRNNANGERLLKLEFPSLPDRLKLIRAMVGGSAKMCGFDGEAVDNIVLAVDEACQNVIRHAYDGKPDGKIILEVVRYRKAIEFLIKDYAPAVDVDKIRPRDIKDLRPGGLGTHFMRKVMDEVEFMDLPTGQKDFIKGNTLRMMKRMNGNAR